MSADHEKNNIYLVIMSTIILFICILFFTPDTPINFFDESKATPHSLYQSAPPTPLTFANHTLDAGILFSHQQGNEKLSGLDESLGSGACAFDYNNDGWLDLFLIGGSGQTHHFGRQQWW